MRSSLLLAGIGGLPATHGPAYSLEAQRPDSDPGLERRPARPDPSTPGQTSSEISFLRSRQDLDVKSAAKAAIDAMNSRFFDSPKALWSPDDPWWLSGVALTTVIDYMRKTTSSDYLDQVKTVIQVQRAPLSWWPQGGGEFRADSTDDTGWWALAMVRMFDLTGDGAYLNVSVKDEAYMYQYWTDSPCGGGIYVDIETKSYKNAIANELYIKLAASLHNRVANDTTYLSRAEKAWSWFKASGMINSNNLINDGLDLQNNVCVNKQRPVWTYNQGVILGGLVELYRATQNQDYLTSARAIADAVVSSTTTSDPRLTRDDGILTEASCEPDEASGCNQDQQIFKGVFAYNLAELDAAIPDGSRPYRGYLQRNARSAHDKGRWNATNGGGGGDLYDVSWAGPFRNSTIGKQASAVGLFVSLV